MRSTDHPQDDLLIVEALYRHGHEIRDKDLDRSNRAFDLAAGIADGHGLDVSDALFQVERAEDEEPSVDLPSICSRDTTVNG